MKLLTQEQFKQLPSFQQIQSIPRKELILYFHIYNPLGMGNWFVMAGQEMEDDFICYGLQILEDSTFEVFSLNEFEALKFPFGGSLKLDSSFKPIFLLELNDHIHKLLC